MGEVNVLFVQLFSYEESVDEVQAGVRILLSLDTSCVCIRHHINVFIKWKGDIQN